MALFGLSFGKSKNKIDQTTNVNKTETGSQSGTESTFGQTGTTSSSTSTGSTSGTGTSTTTQGQQQTSQSGMSQSGTTSSQSFTDQLAGNIEESITGLLSGIQETASTVGRGVAELNDFDSDAFVADSMAAAGDLIGSNLESDLNTMFAAIGGRGGENSMASLLANRLTGAAGAQMAGVRGQAEATAQDILAKALAASSDSMGSVNALAPALIQAFKGGNVTGTAESVGTETGAVSGTSTGTTATAETSQQQQATQTQSVQQLIQIIDQLMNSVANTTGTERMTGTEKKSGFGASLSL